MHGARLAGVAAAIAALWLVPLRAHAWGAMGHEIVAALADRELSASAREEVRRLLGGRGMASVASWADRYKTRDTGPWHYVNIPRSAPSYEVARDCADLRCVVGALQRQLAILRDRGRSQAARADALRYVIHLVGDLHQPMHCVDDGDKGGNAVAVRWFGRKSTLHEVWDSDILTQARLSTAQQIAKLGAAVRELPRRDALVFGDLVDWANEAHGIAVDVAYDLPADRALGPKYYAKVSGLANLQLLRAGLRLGQLLNEALAGSTGPAGEAAESPVPAAARSCVPREQCCKVCSADQAACGASCIRRSYSCRKGQGCACDAADVCR